jgi:hypothetical protein
MTEANSPTLLQQKVDENGYVLVYMPAHPESLDGYVYLHRLVMEVAVGGRLPHATHVHHRDRNPGNNVLQNLQLLPAALHEALHNVTGQHLERATAECDDWASDALEALRAHYEDARGRLPVEWSTRNGAADLARRARDETHRRSIDVLKGKWDAKLLTAKAAGRPPAAIAAELGCQEQVVRERMRVLSGKIPIVRKSGARPRQCPLAGRDD